MAVPVVDPEGLATTTAGKGTAAVGTESGPERPSRSVPAWLPQPLPSLCWPSSKYARIPPAMNHDDWPEAVQAQTQHRDPHPKQARLQRLRGSSEKTPGQKALLRNHPPPKTMASQIGQTMRLGTAKQGRYQSNGQKTPFRCACGVTQTSHRMQPGQAVTCRARVVPQWMNTNCLQCIATATWSRRLNGREHFRRTFNPGEWIHPPNIAASGTL